MANTGSRASHSDQRRPMPADSLVSDPMGSVTSAVTIDAPPERVWTWLVQIGAGRAGWYSYDWIDNGGRPSAQSILPLCQQIEPGDILPAIPGATDAFYVAVVEPPHHLVLTVPDARGGNQVSYEFLLEPLAHGGTHLIARGRISHRWPTRTPASAASTRGPILIERIYSALAHTPRPLRLVAAGLGHHFMETRMLRGIKRRAEA